MSGGVWLMRHGAAESGMGVADPRRRLTAEGGAEVRTMARAIGEHGVLPDLGLTSPYIRTRTTAEIVWDELGLSVPLWTQKELESGARREGMLAAISEARDIVAGAQNLLVVGHMPDLALLLGFLVPDLGPRDLGFHTGTVARVASSGEWGPGCGVLEWKMSP